MTKTESANRRNLHSKNNKTFAECRAIRFRCGALSARRFMTASLVKFVFIKIQKKEKPSDCQNNIRAYEYRRYYLFRTNDFRRRVFLFKKKQQKVIGECTNNTEPANMRKFSVTAAKNDCETRAIVTGEKYGLLLNDRTTSKWFSDKKNYNCNDDSNELIVMRGKGSTADRPDD